jgi:hypothetical protein
MIFVCNISDNLKSERIALSIRSRHIGLSFAAGPAVKNFVIRNLVAFERDLD